MKKIISFAFASFFCAVASAQTGQTFTDEMSSQWVTVGSVVALPVVAKPTVAKKTTVRVQKAAPAQKPAPSPKEQNAFNKTNTQVKRFKKSTG